MSDFKGSQFEREIILWGVRWYVAYPISYQQLEEMMGERGVIVDHSPLNRWVIKYAPEIDKKFRLRKQPVGRSWRVTVHQRNGRPSTPSTYRKRDSHDRSHAHPRVVVSK
jgi:putative transposase